MVFNTNTTFVNTSPVNLSPAYDVYIIDASVVPIVINLPKILADGTNYQLIRIDSSSNAVTVAPFAGDTIYGVVGSYPLAPNSSIQLNSHTTIWYLVPSGSLGGAIIPFSSGPPGTITTAIGAAKTSTLLGFGSNTLYVGNPGAIDITTVNNMAFSMPRDGAITALSAFFSASAALALGSNLVTLSVQVYRSDPPTNSFVPIPGANTTLGAPLVGAVPIGTTRSGSADGLYIPVNANTRLLMVFFTFVDTAIPVSIFGYMSAGLNIV